MASWRILFEIAQDYPKSSESRIELEAAANELASLKTMCRHAADEITKHWDAHCDDEGYGPRNLVSRLSGELPPALYVCYMRNDD